jgi:ubiquinone/menaquinone biosynthesis C-methylase UbiE
LKPSSCNRALEDVHYWGIVAETWEKTKPQKLWRAHSDAVNIALLARWLPTKQVERVLKTDLFDEACSAGLYPQLASKAQRVVGIDIALPTLRVNRSRHAGLHMAHADVRWLPFASAAFDVIVSNSTLDHFASPNEIVASLGELYRVLRPGGQLLLTLDNLANPVIALRNALPFRLLHRLGIMPYYVGVTYTPRRLRHMLQRVGFDVLDVDAVMHCPRALVVTMAQALEGRLKLKTQKRLLRGLMAFERLSRWPTRFLTGYFIAVRATKRRDQVEGFAALS